MNKVLYYNFVLEMEKLLTNNTKICVAVSGGIDSMVLIHLIIDIFNIDLIAVAHCNFMLRKKESYEDEIFVKNFCYKKNIRCYVKRFDTFYYAKKNKLSIQMAARKLRYKWFNELLTKNSYKFMILAHHFNDSVETFFINISRGTGIKGLLGIPKINGKFIRPLLEFSRKDILSYANKKNINWRVDKSNENTKYLRNKLRLSLNNSSFFSNYFYNGLKNTIKNLYNDNLFIEKEVKKICKKITIKKKNNPFIWKIEYEKIKKLHPLYLFKIFYPYGFIDIDSIKRLIYSQSGKQIISKKYRIIKDRNCWILVSNKLLLENKRKVFTIYNIEIANKIHLPINMKFILNTNTKIEHKKDVILIDFEKIQFPLSLRTWRKGDFFMPINMNGKKKISKYYKDQKFSLLKKYRTWILINGNKDIILIVKNRLDNRFKLTKNTKKILEIVII
ncbi:tRNA lysidine(34) synthetase TilS [Blattabacterium cuenoti]|uniref:tRNA lysidine(34) synthetase TilS n=1 Tax=Blattabacterium cuenoti TaxID=1653831 RepID=UPI00163D051E|nr:tRNA lysidine(34) synthetase TilS [Blattabacterium cuenoti]